MRLSVDPEDPDFLDGCNHMGVRVFLDGTERSEVVTADEERGLLVRYVTDERGKLVLNAARTEPLRETLHGAVAIEAPHFLRAIQAEKEGAGQ
ncbi:hypothetical protein [Azohydromonas aeria]|uniref:hypothetical protein n=1 Tax=Azohydromonas aeria TaxID=2590212 RepID=UPI0012FC35C7|nr:hypothetical protein [Azohydromonas aeria]